MLLLQELLLFHGINIIMRAKKNTSGGQRTQLEYQHLNEVVYSVYKLSICSFNANRLKYLTFSLVLPLLLACTVVRIEISSIKAL